jgi:hypothetical protein
MEKKSVYLNQRVRKDVVKRLRKFEREYRKGKRSSISESIDLLLSYFDYLKDRIYQ